MAFGRRENETTSSETSSKPGKLRKTMPTRFADGDQRANGHETTYQSSRGGWLKPRQ